MTDRAFRNVRRTMRYVADAIPDTEGTEVLLRLGYEGDYIGSLGAEDVEVLASHRCATRASMRIGYAAALGEVSDALLPPERSRQLDVPLTATGLINQIRNHYSERIAKAESEARARRVRAADNDDETLAVALGNHAAEVAADNGKAGYRRGYQQAQADAVPDDRAGAQAVYKEVFGNWPPREATVEEMAQACRRKVHAAALEVARSVARQLYGQAGRTVRNPRDLVALVRARTEFEVREATGEAVHEGTTVHTPLRDESIRRDTLRAVASWISQNWLTDLDFAPDDLTTPESLAARLQPELDRRVTDAADDGRLRGARAVYRQVTGKPTMTAGDTFGEVVADLIEHVGKLEADAEQRGERTAALHIQRAVCGPWNNDLKREDQQTWTEIVTALTDRQRQSDLHVLQELHNHLHGPDADTGTWDTLPADTTVTGYADRLLQTAKDNERTAQSLAYSMLLRDLGIPLPQQAGTMAREDAAFLIRKHISSEAERRARSVDALLDEQTELTAYRIIREGLGLDAAKPLRDRLADDNGVETDRERIILTARDIVAKVAAGAREERERVVRYIQQCVAEAWPDGQ